MSSPDIREAPKHEVEPTTTLRRLESFARCARCGAMATRITKNGKVGKWRHL